MLTSVYRTLSNFFGHFLSLIRAKTMGSRALVIRDEEVLLVKHSYQSGWYTIGGAVESGESPLQAIIRELYEEVGVKAKAVPELIGLYLNDFEKRDDYVALYLIKDFSIETVSSAEIAEKQWFPLKQLPRDATPATRRRVEEFLGLRSKSDRW